MYHVIINPASRSGRGQRIWTEQIEPALKKEEVSYCPHFSRKAGDTVSIVADLFSREKGDISLIILGGDGTVNEALQGMDDTRRAILGYVPTGSSNDLARDLKIPKKPLEALELILHSGRVRAIDLGVLTYPDGERRRFAVSCGIGFDAAVCQEAMHSRIKDTMNRLGLGKLTYLGVALHQLFSAKAISGKLILENEGAGKAANGQTGDGPSENGKTINGKSQDGQHKGAKSVDIGNMLFTACMLHRFEGGGFMFAPDAVDNDGVLNLCAVGDLPKLLILFALPTAFYGKHYIFRGITPYQSEKLAIETSMPLWVHTDGEVTRKSSRICVGCEREALRVVGR